MMAAEWVGRRAGHGRADPAERGVLHLTTEAGREPPRYNMASGLHSSKSAIAMTVRTGALRLRAVPERGPRHRRAAARARLPAAARAVVRQVHQGRGRFLRGQAVSSGCEGWLVDSSRSVSIAAPLLAQRFAKGRALDYLRLPRLVGGLQLLKQHRYRQLRGPALREDAQKRPRKRKTLRSGRSPAEVAARAVLQPREEQRHDGGQSPRLERTAAALLLVGAKAQEDALECTESALPHLCVAT